jgi:integrase
MSLDYVQDREKALHHSRRHQGNGQAMPRRAKGPRLYLDPKRSQWVIRDGSRFLRTGCGEGDGAGAERFLAQYIAFKHKPEASGAPLIADVLHIYGKEVAPTKKSARNMGYNIGSLLKWWGEKTVADITAKSCRAYVAARTKMGAGADLGVLKSAVAYWHQEYGPLTAIPVFWRPKGNPPKDRWLTRQEAAAMLRAARKFRYQHSVRMILIGLYTGSRPGIVLALRWDQIDLERGVMFRVPRGTDQGDKKRSPPVRLGRRILAHLRRWKAIDGHIPFVCHFDGKRVLEPHGSWKRITKEAGLVGVTPHTLRHTRATWMAQKGVPLFQAAGFLGMTVKTLENVYAHHHPDYQEEAANI